MVKYRILVVVLMVVMLFACNGCIVEMYENYQKDNAKKETTSVAESSTPVARETITFLGVVTEVDTENKLIWIRDVETSVLVSYTYTGASDVRDKYGNILAMALIEPGYMVKCEFRTDDNRVLKLSVSEDTWENLRVHNWKYSKEDNSLRIGTQYYDLYDYVVVAADGVEIDIRELSEVDELVVRGYGNMVYSISVLKGHGYISLKNEAFFIGGIVTVGNDAGLEITDDMLIMVGEGEHTLSVSKDGVGGSVEVEVKRNKEIIVDVGNFQGELEKYGSIRFKIQPEGAKLYIDGRAKLYDELVELAFGTYKIAIEAEGYVPYIGDLVVGETFLRKTISLGLEGEKEEETTAGEGETTTGEEETTTGEEETTTGEAETTTGIAETTTGEAETTTGIAETTTGEAETTIGEAETTVSGVAGLEPETTVIYTGTNDVSKYNIHIDTPTGAEAYFDSEYIGMVPVSIPKQSGIHTIIFKKDGCKTKAYTIEIAPDAQDEYFSFRAMETAD